MEYTFPVYLKILTGINFYKIKSAEEFEEVQCMGAKRFVTVTKLKTYVDRLLIQDMLSNEGERWLTITEKEYEEAKNSGEIIL